MRTFSMTEWLKRSTTASKVPMKVTDQEVLRQIAARLRHAA